MKLLLIILSAGIIWIHFHLAIMHGSKKSYIRATISVATGIFVTWQFNTVVLNTGYFPEIPFGVNIVGTFVVSLNIISILTPVSDKGLETPEKMMCMKAVEMQHEEKEIIISVLKDYAEKHYDKREEF